MNVLLVLLLFVNVAIFVIISLAFCKFRHIMNEFYEFITPASETEPSPMQLAVGKTVDAISDGMVKRVKGTMLGQLSGKSRAESAIDGAIAQDSLSLSNPVIGAVLQSMPSLAKILNRNPFLAELAMSKLAGKAGAAAPGNGNSPPARQFDFNIGG